MVKFHLISIRWKNIVIANLQLWPGKAFERSEKGSWFRNAMDVLDLIELAESELKSDLVSAKEHF